MGFFVTSLIIVNAFVIQFRDAFSFKLMMFAGILSSDSDAERSHTHDHVQRSSNLATYGQSYAILKLSALPCRIFAAQNLTLNLPRPLQVSRLRISARNRKQNGRLLRSRSKPRSIWPTVTSSAEFGRPRRLEECWPQELSGSCRNCGSFRRNGCSELHSCPFGTCYTALESSR